jgi:hypothetical protein
MKPRKFNFFHPNDGTVPYPNNDNENNNVLWERIQELQDTVERQRSNIDLLNIRLQSYTGTVIAGDYQNVRDEQRINRETALHFTNRDDFVMHLRRQQASRIVERLLEENLIEHTFRPDEPNGDYYSRMELRIVRNNSE